MDITAILSGIIVGGVVIVAPMVLIKMWISATYLKRRALWLENLRCVLLLIQVPKANEKSPLAAEQMFSALHGILRSDPVTQEFFSFEILATKDSIKFFVYTPVHLRDFLEGQIYAQFPEVIIKEVQDYTKDIEGLNMPVASTELALNKEDYYPIRTFPSFEVDPLAGITSVLTKLEEKEEIWFQIVVKPVSDAWQTRGINHVKTIRDGRTKMSISFARGFANFINFLGQVFVQAINPKTPVSGIDSSKSTPELSGPVQEALKAIEQKVTKLGFETVIRAAAIGKNEMAAKTRVQSLVAAFKQFNSTNQNGFMSKEVKSNDWKMISDYQARNIERRGYTFNTEELASIYHFPNQSVVTPGLEWSGPKKGEAPANLPLKEIVPAKELTIIGRTDFRDQSREFGIKIDDRRRHIYVVGKSGVGKSVLLENMILDDIFENRGVIVVDPHGELADKITASVPKRRLTDTVIFDPADRDFPIAFNLLENVHEDMKPTVASGFVGIFKKIFGYSWGPRLEHILRNTVLTLLDAPGSTMLGIPKILTDAKYREEILEHVKDPVIHDFWINEFGAMDNKQRAEAVSPVLNKVGQFLSTPTIRNIVGQQKSNIDIREIMDQEKILIVNLSRGKIGEDNTALMGAMMITKVQLAAMSRANVPEEQRPDCFLYVDEFQNFATESFATILSEARKYHLGLTVANQYIAQMPEEVRDAVFGNVGTLVSFRVGAADGEFLVKEFAPIFEVNDLVNLEKYHIYTKLLIDGIAANAFSAQTLPPRVVEESYATEIREFSRREYSRPKSVVEDAIEKWSGIKEKLEAQRLAKATSKMLVNASSSLKIGNAGQPQAGMPRPSQSPVPVQPQAQPTQPKPDNYSTTFEPEKVNPTPLPIPSGRGVVENKVEDDDNSGEMVPRELKVIREYLYKQHDQKGGRKWFIGEKVEEAYQKEMEQHKKREEKQALKSRQSDVPDVATDTQ